MREDMFKVIVERPRGGRSWARKSKLRYLDTDDGRPRITGKRLVNEHSGATKYLNENLAPLRRYLFKQRGRKWDDVFSEICARLDTGSTVKMHVREHLDDFVIRNVRVDENGMYWAVSRWGGPRTPDQWRPDLYVCPIDGQLNETRVLMLKLGLKRRRYHSWRDIQKQPCAELKQLSDCLFLIKLKSVWYSVETDANPACAYGCPKDVYEILKSFTSSTNPDWKVLSKKQLSKKELAKYGLKNGGDDV